MCFKREARLSVLSEYAGRGLNVRFAKHVAGQSAEIAPMPLWGAPRSRYNVAPVARSGWDLACLFLPPRLGPRVQISTFMAQMCAIMRYLVRREFGVLLVLALAGRAFAFQDVPTQRAPIGDGARAVVAVGTPFDASRFADLLALIEGQNPPAARRTGTRELLRQHWPETATRLAAILRGSNRLAKTAVALALSDLPEHIVPEFTEPLLAMLADDDPAGREAAAAALAAGREDHVLPRLRSLALNADHPMGTRLASIDTLGRMTRREAVAILAELVARRSSSVAASALAALERATAQDFQGDIDAALTWWQQARATNAAEWQRLQIKRLARQNRTIEQRVRGLEQRLVHALRENYIRTPEAERPALLNAHLTDVSAVVRGLGLALVQSELAQRRTLSPETIAHTREMLSAIEPTVRAAAVRTVATLRDPADGDRFRRMLASERQRTVREALINGLGYVGAVSAVPELLAELASSDPGIASETVTALGRLAERDVLDETTRIEIGSALLARAQATPSDAHAMRERLLWAMSRVGDPRFAIQFVAAIDTPESSTVRLAAVRGIAVLIDPKTVKPNGATSQAADTEVGRTPENGGSLSPRELIDALMPATADLDPTVRRAAVETLGQFASSAAHAEALLARVSSEQETEESIRVSAWRGVVRAIAARPPNEFRSWLERVPGDEETRDRLSIELLRAAEKALAAQPDARGELGWVRTRLAEHRVRLGELEEAVSVYLAALEDLHAAEAPELSGVAIELLRIALVSGRYDERIAAALAGNNPAVDGKLLWEGVREEVERRLEPDSVDQAIAMLAALQANPPASMPADVQAMLAETFGRARQVRAAADVEKVNAALEALRQKPDDQPARETITKLGARAVPALRARLRAALQSEQPNPDSIQQMHDLLRALLPTWPGFPADAGPAEKLKAIESIPQ